MAVFLQLFAAVFVAIASFFACESLLTETEGSCRIFTADELAKYNGKHEGREVYYLAILGSVYDVSEGEYYRPGGGYAFFSGRDASRAFVSGNFSGDGLTDDLTGLTPAEFSGVAGWKKFYDEAENYYYKGKVVGRFYTAEGEPTAALNEVDEMVALADAEKAAKQKDEAVYKTCNSRWKKDTGTLVYCKDGLRPRRLVRDGDPLFSKERCTCATTKQWEQHKGTIMFLYDGCDESADTCKKPKVQSAA